MADMQRPQAAQRYGPIGFVAALLTVAMFETAGAWMWSPYLLMSVFVFGVASAVVLPVAGLLIVFGNKAAQAGRGILIGYLATPLTAAIVIIPIAVVTQLRHLM